MTQYTVFYQNAPDEDDREDVYRHFGERNDLTVQKLSQTHTVLVTLEAKSLDDVFTRMQGEVWSPHGEARDLIMSKGLSHTSMSVNDVVQDQSTNEYFQCGRIGWNKLA